MNNNQKGREKGKKADSTQKKGKNKIFSEMSKSQGTHGKIDANQNFMRGIEKNFMRGRKTTMRMKIFT